jgi:hypothetical protein
MTMHDITQNITQGDDAMFMITFLKNGVKDSTCIICSNAQTAVESIEGAVKILEIEKLY